MPLQPIKIGCGVVCGVDAVPVVLEVSLGDSSGPPRILGLVDPGVREAYYRILGAFKAQGLPPLRDVPTMNFTPAMVRKTGSGFDLPMALGLAGANGQFKPLDTLAAVGEVSLSGEIVPTPGVVSVALAARRRGWTQLVTDCESARIAALVPGIRVYGVATLRGAIEWLRGERDVRPERGSPAKSPAGNGDLDLHDIRGHETPKTALMVAAAGRHNLLLVGPPGSGKSALARRLPGLLPPTTEEEALDVLKIHTVRHTGASDALPDYTTRPMRCPHHTSSAASLLGGGKDPHPGEVSLAQHGVLFMDELPEFRREVLEGLRQPLEDGELTIGRVSHTVTLPADFLLVCAMNPCPCGYLGHGLRPCVCNPGQRQRYRSRVSGPLLDRIDLQVEVPALPPTDLGLPPDTAWSTSVVHERVMRAVARQRSRNGGVQNGRLRDSSLRRIVPLDSASTRILEQLLEVYSMSGRARVRLLQIARTLADLDDRDGVTAEDLHGAARLRGFAGRPTDAL